MVQKTEQLSFEKTVIQEYIETLDDIKVKYMPRSQYVFLGGNILKSGVLYLPDDLQRSDFLLIVKHIHNYYNIHSETIEIVKSKTKILSSILLKIGGSDAVSLKEIPYSQVKKILKEVKTITSKKLSEFDEFDRVTISRYLQNYLSKEFFKELYQVGNKNIKTKLKTLTFGEKQKIQERKASKKNGEFIKFKGVHDYFDIETDFRDFIGIDEMKEKLTELREKNDTAAEMEFAKQCLEKIFDSMNLFPYQLTKENNGFKVKGIIQKKEIYCVGFTLILHSLLEDLGIDHEGLDIQSHIATKVNIGNTSFLFDNVLLDTCVIYDSKNTGGEYSFLPVIDDYGKVGEISDVIVSKILLNTGYELFNAGKLNESIYAFEKSYSVFKNFDAILNIARNLNIQHQYDASIEICKKIQGEFGPLFPEMQDSLYEVWADSLYGLKKYQDAWDCYKKIDESIHPGIYMKMGDCLFHLGKLDLALQMYLENLSSLKNEQSLKKAHLKIYLLKKLLKITTLFAFRYKREKRWIDQNIERQDIFDLVCEF